MSDTLITESEDILMMETVAGVPGSSDLNDISIVTIYKYPFTENPELEGWLIGADWQWDAVNGWIEII
jgi:hypothetical protein